MNPASSLRLKIRQAKKWKYRNMTPEDVAVTVF